MASSRTDRRRRPQPGVHKPAEPPSQPGWTEDLVAERAVGEVEAISRRIRKHRLVLFFGRGSFSDNAKYVFLRALARRSDYDVVWATPHRALAQELAGAGLPVFDLSAERDASLAVLLRAAVAVFCINPLDSVGGDRLLVAAVEGAEKVQLWHGVSAKRLVLQLVGHLRVSLPVQRQYWELTSRADVVLSSSPELDPFWRDVFGTRALLRAGLPRNEVLLREATPQERVGAQVPVRTAAALTDPDRRKLLLAPTWRRRGRSPALTESTLAEIADWARARHADVFLKQHPIYDDLPDAGPRAAAWHELDPGLDLYPWLACFDALVTDYSSIMFDFLLTGRPIGRLDVGSHETFEPDFSLVPGGADFAHTLVTGSIGRGLDAMFDDDGLAGARCQAAARLLGERPGSACDDVLDMIDELVERRTAEDWLLLN